MAGRDVAIGVGMSAAGLIIGALIGWGWARGAMAKDSISMGLDLFPTLLGAIIGGAVGWWIAKLWMK